MTPLPVFFAGEAPVRRIERIEDDDGSLNFSLQDCDLEEQAEDLRKANHLSGQTTPEDETTSKEARQMIFFAKLLFLRLRNGPNCSIKAPLG